MSAQVKNPQIAQDILTQLGGNKFLVMTGCKTLVDMGNGIRMTLSGIANTKAKWLYITLNSMDTYDMKFVGEKKKLNKEMSVGTFKCYDSEIYTVSEHKGIYNDMLRELFTKETGLYTSLGTMGRR